MAKIKADVRAALDVLSAIDEQLQKTPGLMQTAFKREVGRIRSQMLAELRVEPGKPKYPIRWTSSRQRRAVMAKLRKAGNLPYQRTHELSHGWRVDYTETADGGILTAGNETPYASFVVGDDQQGFHKDTGWLKAPDILEKWSEIVTDRLIQTYITVADPFAGVPR